MARVIALLVFMLMQAREVSYFTTLNYSLSVCVLEKREEGGGGSLDVLALLA